MKQSGFTLIELTVVMVIMGVLAAVVMPRYFDVIGAAKDKAMQANVASIESSSRMNFSSYLLSGGSKGVKIASGVSCKHAISNLIQGGLPSNLIVSNKNISGNFVAGDTYSKCYLKRVGSNSKYHVDLLITK